MGHPSGLAKLRGQFPSRDRPLGKRQIAAFNPVVEVTIAGRAQLLVIQARLSNHFPQLHSKPMYGLQGSAVAGTSIRLVFQNFWNPRSSKVATTPHTTNPGALSTSRRYAGPSFPLAWEPACNTCARAIFAHQNLVCDPGHPFHIKRKRAQAGYHFVEAQKVYFCSHWLTEATLGVLHLTVAHRR